MRSRRTQGGRRVGFHGRKQDTGSVSRDIHRARDEATVLVGTHPAACWMTFGWRSSIQCFISVLGGAAAYRCLFAPARLPRRVARAFGRHNARREATGFCEGSAQVEETEREGGREGGKALRLVFRVLLHQLVDRVAAAVAAGFDAVDAEAHTTPCSDAMNASSRLRSHVPSHRMSVWAAPWKAPAWRHAPEFDLALAVTPR